MDIIQLHDKKFRLYISESEIQEIVKKIAQELEKDYPTFNNPLFLVILNGSFMFASDLMKYFKFPCEISFVRFASYQDTQSTGIVKELIGLNEDVSNRTVIILEDIVDTGHTLQKIVETLSKHNNSDYRIVSAFFKPDSYKMSYPIHYIGKKIPNDFIVGYGLDYNGLGRNLPNVYVLHQ
ncbi:MAG TPA: hypoxanthine phosphoribosyltransferase [Bacteroidia bacterium]|nr:hypoxanthine phosphoribosyltransferase [Bacteroidia bacterium]